MDKAIYALCAITAFLCALFLSRAYVRTRLRLQLWSSVCFVMLAVANVMVIVDRWLVPDVDLMNIRLVLSLLGVMALIYGLVWERE